MERALHPLSVCSPIFGSLKAIPIGEISGCRDLVSVRFSCFILGELLVLLSQYSFKVWQMSICDRLSRSGSKMVVWFKQPVGQIAMQVLESGWAHRDFAIWHANHWNCRFSRSSGREDVRVLADWVPGFQGPRGIIITGTSQVRQARTTCMSNNWQCYEQGGHYNVLMPVIQQLLK